MSEPEVALALSMRVLNSTQMRDVDRRTIDEVGIPSAVLMENAGRQVVAAMEQYLIGGNLSSHLWMLVNHQC